MGFVSAGAMLATYPAKSRDRHLTVNFDPTTIGKVTGVRFLQHDFILPHKYNYIVQSIRYGVFL